MTSELKNNIFSGIPGQLSQSSQLPEEVFQVIIQNKNIKIERIISKGQKSDDGFWYNQEQSEWVLILQGAAHLEFEDGIMALAKGDYVNIEAHKKHRVKWTMPNEETIWLAVFY